MSNSEIKDNLNKRWFKQIKVKPGFKTILNMPFELAFEITMEEALNLPIQVPIDTDMGKFEKYYHY